MTDTLTDPRVPAERLSLSFMAQAKDWLGAPASLVHWWSPEGEVLDGAIQGLLDLAHERAPAQTPCVFRQGNFLALLQQLNGLLAAAQQPEPLAQPMTPQLWVLDRAEQVSAEHIDILRRICQHYPDLQIHLALFSQTAQAPVALPDLPVHALSKLAQAQHGSVGARHRRWLVSALVLSGVAWLVLGLWPADQGSMPTAETDRPAVQASEPAASETVGSAPEPVVASAPAAQEPVSASRRWLLGLPAECLVVVHVQASTLQEAESFRTDKPVLANARILLTSVQGQPPRYLVVTAPFRSSDRAQNYMQRLEWKSTARSMGREELLAQVPR